MPGSLRGRTGKASGGQPGHKGGVAAPDRIIWHEAQTRRHCRAAVEASMCKGVERRQVFDLPKRLIEVTEHQMAVYACGHCRGKTRADFAEGGISPTQYGEHIRAAVYLNVRQLLLEERAAQALSDLFGAPLICAARSTRGPWAPAMRNLLLDAAKAVRQAKETGESARTRTPASLRLSLLAKAAGEGFYFHRNLPRSLPRRLRASEKSGDSRARSGPSKAHTSSPV